MRILRGGQICEFKNLARIIIIIALLKKNENLRILNFVKSPKIGNSLKFKHAKITRSTVFIWPLSEFKFFKDLIMHQTCRKIANWSLEDHKKTNSMVQRNSNVPGHLNFFNQNSTAPGQPEKLHFSRTFPGQP